MDLRDIEIVNATPTDLESIVAIYNATAEISVYVAESHHERDLVIVGRRII